MEYLSDGWRSYLGRPGLLPDGGGVLPLLGQFQAPDGRPLGSYVDPFGDREGAATEPLTAASLAATHLDPHGIDRALLAHDAGALAMALPNPHLAAEIARAVNDRTVARWLDADARLTGAVLVPSQLPDVAADEVRRAGAHPRMGAVLLAANGLDKPFGHPVYHPIYAAAEELGLTVVVVAGANAMPEQLSQTAAGGEPATFAEYDALAGQAAMTHLVSLVAQGVFEKHPALTVLFLGCGVTWIAPLLWRFDSEYKALRREAPWMRRSPSEYLRDHVRVGTHPLEPVPERERLCSYLEAFDGLERVLCFSSGFPRRGYDRPAEALDRLPVAWRERVAGANARGLFGEEVPTGA